MIIMYLLYKQLCELDDFDGMNVDTVLQYVKYYRNVVDPNNGFMQQLQDFEVKCRNGEVKQMLKEFDI